VKVGVAVSVLVGVPVAVDVGVAVKLATRASPDQKPPIRVVFKPVRMPASG
jgi:hypothetical protein